MAPVRISKATGLRSVQFTGLDGNRRTATWLADPPLPLLEQLDAVGVIESPHCKLSANLDSCIADSIAQRAHAKESGKPVFGRARKPPVACLAAEIKMPLENNGFRKDQRTLSVTLRRVASVVFAVLATAAPAAERPNILFLLSDDHSYPFLSCYGDANVKTPTLDRLASEGIKLHRYFTAAPQCVPSRAALMTGRSPVAARITRFSSPLARDEVTFPELLREQAGYYTGVCGRSYHLDGSGNRGGPEVGELLEKHKLRTFAERVDFLKTGGDAQVAGQVTEFLDGCPDGKPFFLWANFSDPHHVWNAPAEFRPDPASLKLPAHWPDLPGVREQVADYCAEVNRVDRTIAGVLDVLRERKLLDSTLIVFTGDNGAALPHGKGSLYDPGSNVPCLVRWPGVVPAGRESRALLSGEDLGPTLLEAAGLKPHPRMTGVSFLPLVKGEEHTPRKQIFVERGPHGSAPVTVNMSNSGYDLGRAVRSNRYKFIYNCTPWLPYSPVDSAGGAGWSDMKGAFAAGTLAPELVATYFTTPRPVYELYDLEADPSELHNLSGKQELADVEHELRVALAEKMILDFDYLPLPDLGRTGGGGGRRQAGQPDRAANFARLDVDGDGQLTEKEFSARRQPEEARKWFLQRDADGNGVISREEYLPEGPLPKKPQ